MAAQRYIDVHLHLADAQYDNNRDWVIDQAMQAGVEYMMCVSAVEQDWDKVLEIAKQHQCVIPFLGVHPWAVEELADGWDRRLFETVQRNKCGIGEIGLDRQLTKADFELQCDVFTKQVEIAVRLERPVTIHCLKAYGRIYEILSALSPMPKGSFIHSYSGSREMIPQLAGLGLMFSYNGKALDQTNKQYIANIEATPLESILLETDSPFMLPLMMKTQTTTDINYPSNLPVFAQRIAEIKNIPLETLAAAAYKNSYSAFGGPSAVISEQ